MEYPNLDSLVMLWVQGQTIAFHWFKIAGIQKGWPHFIYLQTIAANSANLEVYDVAEKGTQGPS